MSERPTPETDDQYCILAINDLGYQIPCVDIEFARRLERERDEALYEKSIALLEVEEAIRERDEALRHLEDIKEYGVEEINAAVELRSKLATALVERDEAREDLEFRRELYRFQEAQLNEAREELHKLKKVQ